MSFDKLFSEVETPQWGLPVEIERRNRIRLSVAAFAYEFENDSIMNDGDFDALAETIDVNMDTGNELMDTFFREQFSPHTGQWIHNHPELDKLKKLYNRIQK
jgi:uncharacterized protein YrzB (UPF0473 family)